MTKIWSKSLILQILIRAYCSVVYTHLHPDYRARIKVVN